MLVLGKGEKKHRADDVPKDVLPDMGQLNELPGLLHLRLLGVLTV